MNKRLFHVLLCIFVSSLAFNAAAREKPKNVLLFSDSITWGVYNDSRRDFKNIAVVAKPPENPVCTQQALDNFDKYIGKTKWDVIVLNLGMHDLMYKDPKTKKCRPLSQLGGGIRLSQAEFEKNLTALVKKLKATEANVIWCNIPPILRHDSLWQKGSEIPFNKAAAKIMTEHNVPVVDVHSYVLKLFEEAGKKHPQKFEAFVLGHRISKVVLPAIGKALNQRKNSK